MSTDKKLLEWYYKGFKDELWGSTTTESNEPIENVAYRLGAAHAIIGDDIRDVDYLSKKEILKLIKIK